MVWIKERKNEFSLKSANTENSRLNSQSSDHRQKTQSERTGTQETSIKAKIEIDQSGLSKTQRDWIYQVINYSKNGLTISEIADVTLLQKSSISARVNELAKKGEIKECGKRESKGKLGIVWKTN